MSDVIRVRLFMSLRTGPNAIHFWARTQPKHTPAKEKIERKRFLLQEALSESVNGRCRANMAHTRQSRPDYGLGCPVKMPAQVVPQGTT